MIKTIIFPYDFSRFSESVVPYIKGLKEVGVERIIIVTVLEYETLFTRSVSRELETKEYKDRSAERIAPVKKELENSGFKVDVHVEFGIASKIIVAKAIEENADLIVMGSLGLGLAQNLLGSTAQNVLRVSPIPVLIVPSR